VKKLGDIKHYIFQIIFQLWKHCLL